MRKFSEISDDEFIEAFDNCLCIRDIVEYLGYSRNSGSMAIKVRERIEDLELDASTLVGRQAYYSGRATYSLDEILVKNSTYTNVTSLKKRILDANLLEYVCSCCGNTGIWNGKPLTLELHHKDGDNTNHELANLEFLCPNCHSQTNNYGSKNIRIHKKEYNNSEKNLTVKPKKTVNYCKDCGCIITSRAKLCNSCNFKARRIENAKNFQLVGLSQISRDDLKSLIRKYPFTKIGDMFNVSDNAIRKWCKKYNLPYRISDIQSYSDEEWLSI